MPTAFTHGFVALAAGKTIYREPKPWKFWILAMCCSAAPDLDVGLFAYGVEYEDLWGHRGLVHSIFFAAIIALIVVTIGFRKPQEAPVLSKRWWGYLTFFFAVTASHGFLDAFTNGGLGIAFFSPFDQTRYFFPWQPIEVSNMGLGSMLSAHGLNVMLNEMLWVWLPFTALWLLAASLRRFGKAPANERD